MEDLVDPESDAADLGVLDGDGIEIPAAHRHQDWCPFQSVRSVELLDSDEKSGSRSAFWAWCAEPHERLACFHLKACAGALIVLEEQIHLEDGVFLWS